MKTVANCCTIIYSLSDSCRLFGTVADCCIKLDNVAAKCTLFHIFEDYCKMVHTDAIPLQTIEDCFTLFQNVVSFLRWLQKVARYCILLQTNVHCFTLLHSLADSFILLQSRFYQPGCITVWPVSHQRCCCSAEYSRRAQNSGETNQQ